MTGIISLLLVLVDSKSSSSPCMATVGWDVPHITHHGEVDRCHVEAHYLSCQKTTSISRWRETCPTYIRRRPARAGGSGKPSLNLVWAGRPVVGIVDMRDDNVGHRANHISIHYPLKRNEYSCCHPSLRSANAISALFMAMAAASPTSRPKGALM